MRNLVLYNTHLQKLLHDSLPLAFYLDEFSKRVIILTSDFKIKIFSYEDTDIFSNFLLKLEYDIELLLSPQDTNTEILVNLMQILDNTSISLDCFNSPVKFFLYKHEDESVTIVLKEGHCLTFFPNGKFIRKDLISDRNVNIIAMEISPNLERVVAVLSNFQLMILNYDMEVITLCKLDDGDRSQIAVDEICKEACISWRGDSQFFSVLYSINTGRKCLVRDLKMNIVKGPARADNKVVYSVAEDPVANLSNVLSWQPGGSLIAFFQENTPNDSTLPSLASASSNAGVIFAEKNCLRHGEFWIDGSLYPGNCKIRAKFLKWNLDMPLLVVNLYLNLNLQSTANDNTFQLVHIYHRSNYEWTLKYAFALKPNQSLFSIKFSDIVPTRLLMFFSDSTFQCIDFKFEYSHSLLNNNSASDNGSVAVLNGNVIKLSPLGYVNIPPPMALENFKLTERVLPFRIAWWKNYLFVLSSNRIDVIETKLREYKLHASIYLQMMEIGLDVVMIKNFIFMTNMTSKVGYFIVNQAIYGNDSHEQLVIMSYGLKYLEQDKSYQFLDCIKTTVVDILRCGGIFNSMLNEQAFDRNFFKIQDDTDTNTDTHPEKKNVEIKNINDIILGNNDEIFPLGDVSQQEMSLPYFYIITHSDKDNDKETLKALLKEDYSVTFQNMNISSHYDILSARSGIVYHEEEKIFYLTKNNRLFVNNTLLAMDVTSFDLFKHFLVFTQTSNTPYNTLHVIDLNKKEYLTGSSPGEPMYIPNFQYKDFNTRTIERGGVIVTCSQINVVLQMPRGNLETIYPRLIVLHAIMDLIKVNESEARNYGQAFEIARKHKINPNFLYDIDPEGFFRGISLFISQVEKSEYINLFINSLENSLCEEILGVMPESASKEQWITLNINNKINHVCDEMRKALMNGDNSNQYITSILYSYIKKSPPEYLEALKLVQNLKIDEKNNLRIEEVVNTGMNIASMEVKSTKVHHSKGSLSADKALEFLCWVVKAETLFDFALKTYDFELVIMVAKHTQKDPKEYLPYLKKLQDLQSTDPVLMKYQINFDLKFYSDALFELSKGGDKYFDKCMELITKHVLYEYALTLFTQPINECLYCNIYEEYGKYLLNVKKNPQDAAWCFLRSKTYKIALQCFTDAGCANEAILLLHEMKLIEDKQEVIHTLSELIETCTATKRHSELEKIFTYLSQNKTKFSQEDTEQSMYYTLISKLLDSFFQCKKWKSAYFVYDISMKSSSFTPQNSMTFMKQFQDELLLCSNLQLNELKKNSIFFEEKYNRLLKVQNLKRNHPEQFQFLSKDKPLEDNVSDSGSVISGKSSGNKSSMSKSSKVTKKNQQKMKKRTVKEGSPVEEEYLIMVLTELKLSDDEIESIKELITVLNLNKLCNVGNELANALQSYIKNINDQVSSLLSVAQQEFIKTNPSVKELFPSMKLGDVGSTSLTK